MTLHQLECFVLVARLGSVRQAAERLGISVSAVSQAVAGLRHELDDALYVRSGNGIALTPGGGRLAARAVEILGLTQQARQEVREQRSVSVLRVIVGVRVAEAAGALLEAFAARNPHVEPELTVEPVALVAELLRDRRADVALGAAPGEGCDGQAFLRYQLVAVVGRDHRWAGERTLGPGQLARLPWLTGPFGLESATPEARFLRRHDLSPTVLTYPSQAAALDAAAAGHGLAWAVGHSVRRRLERGELTALRAPPLDGLWHAVTLAGESASAPARALQRFATTPLATQAVLGQARGLPPGRYRPAVHVTLWRGAGA